jgi:AraC-like DNA-binding protein
VNKKMDILINNGLLTELFSLTPLSSGSRRTSEFNRLHRPRTLDRHAFVWLFEGKGTLHSDAAGTIPVKAGEGFFLFPGVPHIYGPSAGEHWKEFWIFFEGPLVQRLAQSGALLPERPHFTPPCHRHSTISRLLARITEMDRLQPIDYPVEKASRFLELMALLLLPPEKEPEITRDERPSLSEMKEILLSHISTPKRITEIFRTSSVPYNTLRMSFKRMTGLSPARYLNKLRMEKAMELLIWTDLPIRKIALQTGFEDPYHFSRVFRCHTQTTPTAYRRKYLL